MYQIIGNRVVRDGEVAAVVLPDGMLETPEGMEKYRTQSVKELAKVGRRNDDGTFVFVDEIAATEEIANATEPETEPEPQAQTAEPETEPEPQAQTAEPETEPERPVISTVRELVAAVEAAAGESAPPLSPFWGDETPEVWAWLRRHTADYNAIRANYDIRIAHNHIEEA